MVIKDAMMTARRLVPRFPRREHRRGLPVHTIQYGALENVTEDGGATVAVRREGAVWREGDAEGEHGEARGIGRFVPVKEGAIIKRAAVGEEK